MPIGSVTPGSKTSMAKTEATEWNRRRNLPGVEVRHMSAGRCFDVQLSLCGKDLGTKSTVSTRGKPGEPYYYLPEID